MPHYSDRDIKEASSVNLIEFAKAQGFEMKKEDNNAHRIIGNGGLFVFEGGFYHHSEQKKGNPIHFCREYLHMKFQEAVQTLLDFKGGISQEVNAPRPQYQKPKQNYIRPPPKPQFQQPQEQQRREPPPQFQTPPQDFPKPQEQYQQQASEFYAEPPPVDEFYNDLPPEFWGEPPPEANDFYGEPMDYQWVNEYQEQHFQGNPIEEQYFQGNLIEEQYFQEIPIEEQYFQGNPIEEQYFQGNPIEEQYFQGNPMEERQFQGNQQQFQQSPPMERPPTRPSQDVPPKSVQVVEDSNLEYQLPPAYEHDFFTPTREKYPEQQREERGELVLPPTSQDKTGASSFQYLTNTRCCDKEIVDKLMKEGLIFEAQTGAKGYTFKNVAFVGKDKNDEPKYCSIRGISKPQAGKEPFKQDVKNSDKSFGFTMKGNSDRIFCCESPIDVLSHASLTKMNGNDPYVDTRISMGGLFDKALDQFLSENPQIKSIVFAFDNDVTGTNIHGQPHNHGQEFAKKCCQKYEKLGYKVQIQTPQAKDFNEMLQNKTKTSVKKQLAYISQEVKTPPKPLVPPKTPKTPKKSKKINER